MAVIPVWASVEDVRAGLCNGMDGRDGREEAEVWVHVWGGEVVELGELCGTLNLLTMFEELGLRFDKRGSRGGGVV